MIKTDEHMLIRFLCGDVTVELFFQAIANFT
jgi:hypothetical protein